MKLNELGEDAVVARLTRSLQCDRRVKLGAGDDCAVVETTGRLQLLKSDCLIEGIHFLPDADPRWIGWKAMCRSISDIAAMGGTPLDALVTVAVRPETEFAWLKRVYLRSADGCASCITSTWWVARPRSRPALSFSRLP